MSNDDYTNLYRVRLCRHFKKCAHPYCGFAHSLAELRAPKEVGRPYPEVWERGVDRWFGQTLTEEQLGIIKQYYRMTPERSLPKWAHALRYVQSGRHVVQERYFSWDYDMTTEVDLLRRARRDGRLPFQYDDRVWELLRKRKAYLHDEDVSGT